MPTPRTPLRPPPGQTSLAARLAAPDQADQVGDTQRGRVSVSALFFLVCGLLAIALQACLLADAVQRFLGWFA